MCAALWEARTVPASDVAKKIMKTLTNRNLFAEQRDVWTLGAALGIACGESYEEGKRETFQNVNSLDPDTVFAAIMIGLYPNLSTEERFKKLVNHAEWGIREIWRKEENGTLDFSSLIQPNGLSTNCNKETSDNKTSGQ
jgi:hypothetical protein